MKKIIQPFQTVLLKRGLCVGCTHPLEKAPIRDEYDKRYEMVQCKCRRRYVFDKGMNSYRRMTLEEEQEYLQKKKK